MPTIDSPTLLVARFLKASNYLETLDAFLVEAGLPPDAGNVEAEDLTIEKVLEEKKVFDLSVRFEKIGLGQGTGWILPAPSCPTSIESLPTSSNLLHVSVAVSRSPSSPPSQCLLATTADRRLTAISSDPESFHMLSSRAHLHDSPILSCVVVAERYLLSTSMSGQVVLFDTLKDEIIEEKRDHNKYVVKIIYHEDADGVWVATAGWDGKIFVYRIHGSISNNERDTKSPSLGAPVASVELPTNPESVVFVSPDDSSPPLLLASRRDSTFLYYYSLPTIGDIASAAAPPLSLIGKQNLAPHSNAWIAFSPSALAISPTDPTLLAVVTSVVPHMKLIIVRLLFPSSTLTPTSPAAPSTQAAQTRANLALQDREDRAIQIHANTLAPQTAYSTPQVCWRPDGSGVWVNGDDGILRGIETKTGKIKAVLKDGHELGYKIRSIWAGHVDVDGRQEEWLVSGGFDRRLIVWRVGGASEDKDT